MKRKLDPVKCCYCGKTFTPVVAQRPDEWDDEFQQGVTTMQSLLSDGLPLECDECNKKRTPHTSPEVSMFP